MFAQTYITQKESVVLKTYFKRMGSGKALKIK